MQSSVSSSFVSVPLMSLCSKDRHISPTPQTTPVERGPGSPFVQLRDDQTHPSPPGSRDTAIVPVSPVLLHPRVEGQKTFCPPQSPRNRPQPHMQADSPSPQGFALTSVHIDTKNPILGPLFLGFVYPFRVDETQNPLLGKRSTINT